MAFGLFAIGGLIFAALASADVDDKQPEAKVYPEAQSTLFFEAFENGSFGPFELSSKRDYVGQPVEIAPPRIVLPGVVDGEQGLLLKSPAKKYGVGAAFEKPITADDKYVELVFQYQVRLQDGLLCGGAYLKFLNVSRGQAFVPTELDNSSPYVVMFGPDRCGGTDKIHFIIRKKNPVTGVVSEHHMQRAPPIATDTVPHLYTLILRGPHRDTISADGENNEVGKGSEFIILLDQTELIRGQLSDPMAFEPPLQPPALINDPDDKKPSDWVDEAQIPDPTAKKPEDWNDDEPATIPDEEATMPEGWLEDEPDSVPDPSVHKPEEWDDDEDGEWEAPSIPNPRCASAPGCGPWTRPNKKNPAYKGKWTPPLIDNPLYIGEWRPRKIKNPQYYELESPRGGLLTTLLGGGQVANPDNDSGPADARIGGLAVEVWTMQGGILMTDFLVSTSMKDASRVAEGRWRKRNDEATKQRDLLADLEGLKKAKADADAPDAGFVTKAYYYLHLLRITAMNHPLKALGTLAALLLPMAWLSYKVCFSGAILGGGSARSDDDPDDEEVLAALRKLRERADKSERRMAAIKAGRPVDPADMPDSDEEEEEAEGDDGYGADANAAPAASSHARTGSGSSQPRGRSPASRRAPQHSHSHSHSHSHQHGHSHGDEDDDEDDHGQEEPLLLAQAQAAKKAEEKRPSSASRRAAAGPADEDVEEKKAESGEGKAKAGARKRRQA
jgi:calnexin